MRRAATTVAGAVGRGVQQAGTRKMGSSRYDSIASLGNVFMEFTKLANEHGSENLGQGFPSFGAPDFLHEDVNDLWAGDLYTTKPTEHNLAHQYTTPGCEPLLVNTLSNKHGASLGRVLEPQANICTTVGAQEALYNVLTAHCDKDEEVVILTPAYDAYVKSSLLHSVKFHTIALKEERSFEFDTGRRDANNFKVDLDALERTLNDKTRVLFLNNPSSPLGKLFTRQELEEVASIVRKYPNLVVVSDEVYEHMAFDGAHVERFASLEGLWDQTISVFSVGKTFSCTGWRIGYAIGPEHLVTPLKVVQAATSFGTSTPLQKLAANAFQKATRNDYFEWLPAVLSDKCRFLDEAVSRAGFDVIRPHGGYFFCADFSAIAERHGLLNDVPIEEQSTEFCRWMTTEIGVTPIPVSAFYGPADARVPGTAPANNSLVRFAFCKSDLNLERAAERLRSLAPLESQQTTPMYFSATRHPAWISTYPNPNYPDQPSGERSYVANH